MGELEFGSGSDYAAGMESRAMTKLALKAMNGPKGTGRSDGLGVITWREGRCLGKLCDV